MIVQRRIATRFSCCLLTAFAFMATVVIGCGGGDVTETGLVPVKGRVTLDGGPWPKAGSVSFIPKDAPKATLTGIGTFDPSGKFDSVIGGFGGGSGLHPGTYWASVACTEGDEAMPVPGQKVEIKDYVPTKYKDPKTSGFILEVEAGKPAEVAYDVKSK